MHGYVYPSYNQVWGPEASERRWYLADLRWVKARSALGEPFYGRFVRRPAQKTAGELRRPGEDVVRDHHPEDIWTLRNPPKKDANGIPIPLPARYSPSLRARYGYALGERELIRLDRDGPGFPMRISGRWHVWDRNEKRWVRARLVRRETKRVPSDLKLQHGPWWPESRQEVINLQRRLEGYQPPWIAEMLERTQGLIEEQKKQDVKDLLEALGL